MSPLPCTASSARLRFIARDRLGRGLPTPFAPLTRLSAALASTGLATVLATPALAQQAPASEETTLNTVVVTASGREQAVREAPASISVITREELDAQPHATLNDVVRKLEGVSVVGGNPNENDISIRGMPGEYTLILVDGKRQNTRETMNRGTGGVQSNLIPPLEAIERIEVVRGPMSSLYGADAMGGVINIITRKVPQRWSGSLTVGGVWQQENNQGNTALGEFWVGGPIKDEVLGLQIYGKTRERREDDFYNAANATAGAYGQNDDSLTVKLSARPAANQDVALEFGRERLQYRTTPGLTSADTVPATAVLRTRHEREHWGITHNGRWDFGSSTVSLYGETGEQTQTRANGPNPVVPKLSNTVLDGVLNLPLGNSLLKLGGQYSQNRLSGVANQDAAPGGYAPNANRIQLTSWALFAENEFFFNDAFTLTTGVRLDDDERYGREWTPRVYGVYKLDPAWTLRGGVAKGFKPPTIRQSTAGYCMTTGGVAGAVPGTLCGSSDLKPETSTTQELGLRFDRDGRYASFTLFNNAFKNKVASYDTGVADPRSPGRNIYTYDNIDRVTLRGLEVGAGLPLARAWKLSGSYTFTDSKRKGGGEPAFDGSSLEGRPLDKSPRHKLSAQLDWDPSDQLGLFVGATYTGKEYWAAFRNSAARTRERSASTTFDVGGHYRLRSNLLLKFALLNVTNKMVPVDLRGRTSGLDGNWMLDEGRRLSLSLNATF
ncbi:TonB-dependent receptor domain-containing protein [Hydrogenophaga palleronii]|uniref:TonB-dependent receptor domain-containing protein n=1 Tax=Hydrogenophaga palleronii TaxID=65655 RepID=UPI0009FD7506|nr:TonB-dependent receptor [Hydrogenophaga palleronii]